MINVTLPFITRGFRILDAEWSLLRLSVAAMSSSDAFQLSCVFSAAVKRAYTEAGFNERNSKTKLYITAYFCTIAGQHRNQVC